MKNLKTQTVKKVYVITITDEQGEEIDRQQILAESPRDALRKAYPFLPQS